jgi:uncharacterized 2Fe-2S/4Fe-4S cluster protein (DUF4445 family)
LGGNGDIEDISRLYFAGLAKTHVDADKLHGINCLPQHSYLPTFYNLQ